MPRDNSTNPWADATNKAVGALYKYYMSKPTAADQIKLQLQQAQLDEMRRSQAMGDFTMQNLSPEIRNDLYMQEQMRQGGDAAGRFRDIMFKPSQVDLGDRKAMMGMGGIVPGTEYTVGTAPKVEYDDKNNRPIGIPGVPSQRINSPMGDLFASVIQQESGGNPNALSPKGAAGIAQIMPDTARDPGFGVTPLQGWDGVDPRTAPVHEQMRFGQDYLGAMIQRNGGDVSRGVASYNAGPGRVDQAVQVGGDNWLEHTPQETQNYVPNVMGGSSIVWPDATGSYPPNLDKQTKDTGKNNISNWIEELAGLYSQLESQRGVISQNNGELSNIGTQLTTTGPGSFIARGMGTENQAVRDRINGLNSMIFTALKPTLGLTGTQLDSKAEADYIKRMMGGVDMDVNATRQLLNTLNRAYGNSDLSSTLQPTNQYSEDVMSTAQKYGITPQEVVRRLRNAGVNGY
ncbi:MAG: lytic transglycosylase domain-containing protein [Hyphomicrobiaceae bacterium]|nr:MAG: lytic transglycosylase domain-containing protein [Hyphomicrobiaceae bacterium]